MLLAFCVFLAVPPLILGGLTQIDFFRVFLGPAPAGGLGDPGYTFYIWRCHLLAAPLSLIVVLGIWLALLFAGSRSRPHHYGLSWARWPANLGLGLGGFLVISPIVLGLHIAATLVFWERPHQLALLGQQPLPAWEWCLIALEACVAAPLLEEVLFRGVLQGWLGRASLAGHIAILFLTLVLGASEIAYDDAAAHLQVYDVSPFAFALLLTSGYVYTMIYLARRFHLTEEETRGWSPLPSTPADDEAEWPLSLHDEKRLRRWREANALLAVYGSAMLFALFHAQAWPSPIALFLMALGLGAIAWRTQSLIGPITFHAAFNLVAFIALYGSTLTGKNGNEQTTAASPSVVVSSVPGSQLPLRR